MSPAFAAAIGVSPIRLELHADSHKGVPMWRSADRWIQAVETAYTARYASIRDQIDAPVSLASIRAVAAAMAERADYRTGRTSRPTNDLLCRRASLGKRTVQRARKALRLLGVATEVFRGRLRWHDERLASWRVGDKSRGWASVYALHPCKSDMVAPHPRRGLFSSPLNSKSHSLGQDGYAENLNGATSSHRQAHGKRRVRPTVDAQGAKLAAQWLRDARTPAFAHSRTPALWAPVLKRAAAAGWTARDLNTLCHEWVTVSGHWIHHSPDNPRRLLATILKSHGDYDTRPAQHDIDREREELAARDRRVADQLALRAELESRAREHAHAREGRTDWRRYSPGGQGS